MPAEISVSGIARSYTDAVRDTIEARLRELAINLAAAQHCSAKVSYFRGVPTLINHAEQVGALVGADKVDENMPPATASEDFAHMLRERPGAFIRIGNAAQRDNTPAALHSPHYDFNDDIIPLGAAYWVGLVRAELSPAANVGVGSRAPRSLCPLLG
jgi:hippurate hydrolase